MVHSAKVNQVILIIIDDIRASHIFDLISKGKLPNLAQLADKGIKCENCITSYPAITFPCYGNIITGSYSGYFPKEGNAVPLYHWIDRTDPPRERRKPPFIRNYSERAHVLKINKDIGKNVKTIFEQGGDGNFLSSTNFLYRGSTFVVAEHFYHVEPIFKNIENAFIKPGEFFPNNEVPKISVGYIPHIDELLHQLGFDHPNYINLILECDKYIGSLINTLKQTGHYDSTAIGFITDHGNYKAKSLYDLEPFFEQKGLIPYNPNTGKGDFDSNFGSLGFFNFPGDTWFHHPTTKQLSKFITSGLGNKKLNIFETLWKIPGVKYMYYRDDSNTPEKGTIHIKLKDVKSEKISSARIEYEGFGKNQKTKYVSDGIDAYGYEIFDKSARLLNKGGYSIEEWLESTNEIDFPMIVDQIPRYFKNPRSCDIMVSTLGDYCFNYEHGSTKAGTPYAHDIGIRNSMIVPFIIGGSPEIQSRELKYCKTTDMVPTLLELLGITPDPSVIGKSVLT